MGPERRQIPKVIYDLLVWSERFGRAIFLDPRILIFVCGEQPLAIRKQGKKFTQASRQIAVMPWRRRENEPLWFHRTATMIFDTFRGNAITDYCQNVSVLNDGTVLG